MKAKSILLAFTMQVKKCDMSRNRFNHLTCSLARALDQAGDWWTFLIVRDALRGIESFDAFQASLGIASNILAARLKQLCEDGLLSRARGPSDGRRAVYTLTPKGAALAPALVALMQLGDEWISGPGNEPIILRDRRSGVPLRRLKLQAGATTVSAEQLDFTLGPGADEGMRRRSRRPSKR